MIEELNRSVRAIENMLIEVPYISINMTTYGGGGATMHVTSEVFDKLSEEVDPCIIVTMPPSFGSFERTMMIGSVRVFALYEV